ncbi:hypothetical protein POTOM_008716 [Populus tomentosa]|uniref:Uncharacterized protein n=1 Tax=Populus tomentosa TaxID=118781 RepID=A0A8X8ACV3_POPTO|nr:hypothetical protein POTOM_008716 [Populus tomentosa]
MSPNQIMILDQSQNQAKGMIQNHTLTNRSFPNHKLVKPNYGYDPKADVPTPKPSYGANEFDTMICLLSYFYTCVGAVIRIACTIMDQYGYRKTPFPCLTEAANAKGY